MASGGSFICVEAVGRRRAVGGGGGAVTKNSKEFYRNQLFPGPFLANIMVRTSEVL